MEWSQWSVVLFPDQMDPPSDIYVLTSFVGGSPCPGAVDQAVGGPSVRIWIHPPSPGFVIGQEMRGV